MKKISIILAVLLYCSVNAQDSEPAQLQPKLGIKAGYFGEFVLHPGFYGGVDYSLAHKQWFDLHWDSEVGAYFHKWNNNAMFLQSSLGARFISSLSAFVDLNFGIGYMLSTPNGDVYSTDDSGNLTTKGKPYYSHLKPSVSLLFGWDGMRKKNIPILVNVGLEGYWQSNFNHSMLPHAALRFGAVYKIKK